MQIPLSDGRRTGILSSKGRTSFNDSAYGTVLEVGNSIYFGGYTPSEAALLIASAVIDEENGALDHQGIVRLPRVLQYGDSIPTSRED